MRTRTTLLVAAALVAALAAVPSAQAGHESQCQPASTTEPLLVYVGHGCTGVMFQDSNAVCFFTGGSQLGPVLFHVLDGWGCTTGAVVTH